MVAAINGHAPAGGCMYALMCDYRCRRLKITFDIFANACVIFREYFFLFKSEAIRDRIFFSLE